MTGGVKIKKGMLRGVESCGMMCSCSELNIPINRFPNQIAEGLMILPTEYEKYLGEDIIDYKFFCFNGEVKCLFIASERQKRREPFFDFFDEDFNLLPIKQGHPNSLYPPHKPLCFETMKDLARTLSKGLPHVRVDFYEVNERVLFGELTFYHFGAVVPFEPEEWDYVLGKYIDLDILK